MVPSIESDFEATRLTTATKSCREVRYSERDRQQAMVTAEPLILRCARERRRRRRRRRSRRSSSAPTIIISRIKGPGNEIRKSRRRSARPGPSPRSAALRKVAKARWGQIITDKSVGSGIAAEEGNSNHNSFSISIKEELGMEVGGGGEASPRITTDADNGINCSSNSNSSLPRSETSRLIQIVTDSNDTNNNDDNDYSNNNKDKEEEEEGGELQLICDGWVRSIKELVDGGIDSVPAQYIQPPQERPLLAEVCLASDIPTIDMRDLLGPRRHHVIESLHHACRACGLFRVTNHGIPELVIESMIADVEAFFQLPLAERTGCINSNSNNDDRDTHPNDDCNKVSSPASSDSTTTNTSSGSGIASGGCKADDLLRQPPVTYVTSFNQRKEKLLNWKDSLRFYYSPLHMDNFKQLPSICQNAVFEFCKEAQGLGDRLYEAISEGLGLGKQGLKEYMEDKKAPIHVNMHYYPPCPNPSLTYGLGSHSDPNILTLLLSNQVNGLQFFKDGSWIGVESTPQSLLVNIGDQLQILTNGEYKSVEHRVVTNSERPRVSVATFFGPAPDTMVGPHPRFVGPDRPPLYKATAYADYVANFYNKGLSRKASLDFASLPPC